MYGHARDAGNGTVMPRRFCKLIGVVFAFLLLASCGMRNSPNVTTETLVLLRHGEKPPRGLGQLSCKGLNRALALPNVLAAKFGRPDYLFAPNPAVGVRDDVVNEYSYVRPLATLEPTAIRLGMSVNTQIGYSQIERLQRELMRPQYASATVFIVWEHYYEERFAKNLVQHFGSQSAAVPSWSNAEYDMIYVIRLRRAGTHTTIAFTVDREGLNDKLGDNCPQH